MNVISKRRELSVFLLSKESCVLICLLKFYEFKVLPFCMFCAIYLHQSFASIG